MCPQPLISALAECNAADAVFAEIDAHAFARLMLLRILDPMPSPLMASLLLATIWLSGGELPLS